MLKACMERFPPETSSKASGSSQTIPDCWLVTMVTSSCSSLKASRFSCAGAGWPWGQGMMTMGWVSEMQQAWILNWALAWGWKWWHWKATPEMVQDPQWSGSWQDNFERSWTLSRWAASAHSPQLLTCSSCYQTDCGQSESSANSLDQWHTVN